MSLRYKGGVISATPPTTSTTSASGNWTLEQQMQAQGAGTWPFGGPFVYIEDVMSTYLYTGNGSTQTITNGIDLSTYGGMLWLKSRDVAGVAAIINSISGNTKYLRPSLTNPEATGTGVSSLNTNGFSLDYVTGAWNNPGTTYASWTFRKQPKFFDVVTFTQSGTSGYQTINHNLGSVPGVIIIKGVGQADGWFVYHRSIPTQVTYLNQTNAAANFTLSNSVTSTTFNFNLTDFGFGNGATYVAYLFAHNAGGFGLTGTDNVISCGSFTVNGSGDCSVSLGYEPQWLMVKSSTAIDNWYLYDNMRGFPVAPSDGELLRPNTSQAGITGSTFRPTSTGFVGSPGTGFGTGIYIAIRRGPMKTPTSGTSVFNPVARSGTGAATTQNTSLNAPDLAFTIPRNAAGNSWSWIDRLRGQFSLRSNDTLEEFDTAPNARYFSGQTSYQYDGNSQNQSGTNYILEVFKRAPGFFDVVCYTGTGSATTVTHNLGVAPELMITKRRDVTGSWRVFSANLASPQNTYLTLNVTDAAATASGIWPSVSSTTFGLNAYDNNNNGGTFVAYLFASCPGVSKVGSYTGTGALQTINCGFTSGARFVLIKATSTTGDWYVWDSARGITASTDPYLLLNSTAAEVTTTNWVDTDSTGFKLTAAGGNLANTNGTSYIFLSIA